MDQIKINGIGIFWHFKSLLILTVVQCRQADSWYKKNKVWESITDVSKKYLKCWTWVQVFSQTDFCFTSEQKSDDQTTTFKFMITQPYSEVF